MKKNKFIDKCKSWLLTLGIASVFGLAALGVNAAKSYEKAFAYEYQDNGVLHFQLLEDGNNIDSQIFGSYVWQYYDNDLDFVFSTCNSSFEIEDTLDISNDSFNWGEDELEIEFTSSGHYLYIYYIDGHYSAGTVSYISVLPSYQGYQSLRNYVLSYNAPQQSGNFITALTSFMSLLGGAIVQLATPVASGVTQFASALFIDNSHLSIMGGIIGIFAGIALAVGITSKVYAWVSTLGN